MPCLLPAVCSKHIKLAHESVSAYSMVECEALSQQLPPLEDVNILSKIVSYLPYRYLTLASVAKTWREAAAVGGTATSITALIFSLLELQQAWPGIRSCLSLSERPEESEQRFAYHLAQTGGGACIDTAKEMIAWIVSESEGLPLQKHLCIGAAAAGRYSLLKWLHSELHCPWNAAEVAHAAPTVAIFKFVWKQAVREANQPSYAAHADRTGRWAGSRQGQTLEENLADVAVTHGSIEELEWLTRSAPSALNLRSNWVYVAAAASQHHIIDWLAEQLQDNVPIQMNGVLTGSSIMHSMQSKGSAAPQTETALVLEAALNCSLPMLQLLHSRGIGRWSAAVYELIMSSAGMAGNLEALQWASHLAPTVWPWRLWEYSKWNADTTCWQLNCLQWAVAQGCPWGYQPDELCRPVSDIEDTAAAEQRRAWAHSSGCSCACPR
jgi:hypothetical protein